MRQGTGGLNEVGGRWRGRGCIEGLVTVEPSRGCHTVLESSPDTEPMMTGLDWIPTVQSSQSLVLHFCMVAPKQAQNRGQRPVASSSFRARVTRGSPTALPGLDSTAVCRALVGSRSGGRFSRLAQLNGLEGLPEAPLRVMTLLVDDQPPSQPFGFVSLTRKKHEHSEWREKMLRVCTLCGLGAFARVVRR